MKPHYGARSAPAVCCGLITGWEEVRAIAYIEVSEDEPLEKAIKRFKRQVEKEGIIREWKKREFFEKPSAILNRKKKALERKRMKRARKVSQMKSY